MLLKKHAVSAWERYTIHIFVKILEEVQGVTYARHASTWALTRHDSYSRFLDDTVRTRAFLQRTPPGRTPGTRSSSHRKRCLYNHGPSCWSCSGGGACLAHHSLGAVDAEALGTPADPAA